MEESQVQAVGEMVLCPLMDPGSRRERLTYLGSTDLRTVDACDGVNQVVCLVDDHDLALQPDPRGLPGGRVQQHLVGQHHHLGEDGAT